MELLRSNGKKGGPTLEQATCTVLTDFVRNHALIDRWDLDARLTKETVASLKASGLKVRAGNTKTQLGGGWDSIWGAIRVLWDLKDYIGALVALVQVPIKLYRLHLHNATTQQLPTVNVHLTIGGDGEIDPSNSYDDLSKRLAVLCQAAHTEAKRLQTKYPMYLFGQTMSVRIPHYGFEASFSIVGDKNSAFNQKRILRVINALRFQEGLTFNVSINRAGLVVHTVTPQTLVTESPHRDKDWRFISSSKKFYTFVSSRMVGGYLKTTPTMPYEQYYDKYLRPQVGSQT
ncbi:MAG TPA: hypothetical protein VIH90_02640 [Candidatus Saccharimonadales bacterium]